MNAEERLNRACQGRDDLTKAEFKKLWLEAHEEPSALTDRRIWRIVLIFAILVFGMIAIIH